MVLGDDTNDARRVVAGRRSPNGSGEGGRPGRPAVRRRAESTGPAPARGARRARGDVAAPIAPRRNGAGRDAVCGGRPGGGYPVRGTRDHQAGELRRGDGPRLRPGPGTGTREDAVRGVVPRERLDLHSPAGVLGGPDPHGRGGQPGDPDPRRGCAPGVVRRADGACVVRRTRRRPVEFVRGPVLAALDRVLVGLAVMMASAAAVVLLGLLADLAAPGT